MIKFENAEVMGWEHAIRGMRNPKNSWERSDSFFCDYDCPECPQRDINLWPETECKGYFSEGDFVVGENDHDLMMRLRNAGTDHRKFMRMIVVYVDITAPLYWWKEFDTYKVGTVADSCSTMHKIADKEFTLEDFSCEHLIKVSDSEFKDEVFFEDSYHIRSRMIAINGLELIIEMLNHYRKLYLETKDKKYWWQMIQLLPSSYNQKRTVMLNYEVLANIYKSRRNHKLDEWAGYDCFDFLCRDCMTCVKYETKECHHGKDNGFIQWIESLPYSEIITGDINETSNRKKDYETLKEIGENIAKGFEEGFQDFYRKGFPTACDLCGAKKRGEVTEEDCAKCPRRPFGKQEE